MSSRFVVIESKVWMATQLEAIQRASFPSLAEDEIITAAHYRKQIERFPEGQLCIMDQETKGVVACATDLRTTVDFDHYEHRYLDAVDHNWLGTHNPNGDWLYGADIGVLPDYRGQGLGRMLYEARRGVIRRLNLRGHVGGGILVGYGAVKDEMGVEEYVARVKAGELFDPTVSIQLKVGFEIHGIIYNYVDDLSCDNKAVFLVWHNPDYRAAGSVG